MSFRVPIGERKVRNRSMKVPRDVIAGCGARMNAKLRTTNTEWMDLSKNEDLGRLSHITQPLVCFPSGAGFIVIGHGVPTNKRVHAVVPRPRKCFLSITQKLFIPRATKAVFVFDVAGEQRHFI